MTKQLEFEWAKSDPDEKGNVCVRVHVVGTDITSFYVLPANIADSFIRAKRDALDRAVRSNLNAIRLLLPQGTIIQ